MHWKVLTFLVCLYGFLKEYRPSEAYLSAYLTGPWKNLTVEEVDNEIYPIWTYAYLLWLVPVFLLADFFRYQPMLVLEGATYIATWSILLWAQGVLAFKFMEICYGLITATEIAYYSYLFAMVSNEHYKIITSFTRAAILMGRFAAYLTGQLLVSFNVMDYKQLNIISMVSVSLAFILAVTLRRPSHSDIFHSKKHDENKDVTSKESDNNIGFSAIQESSNVQKPTFMRGILFLWNELKTAYSDKSVVAWSFWWAFASCGHLQVQNYIQNLWEVITPEDQKGTIYNGAVEAVGTLLSTICVLVLGFLPVNWSRPGLSETVMAIVCVFNTAVLTVMGQSTNIWASYALYSVFRATYHTVITLATLQIAKSLTRQRYGFVFGANMFMALVVETILTVIVVDKVGLGVDVQTQFTVYGGYFGVIGCLFLAVAFYTVYKNGCSYRVADDQSYTVSA
ncbi:solute carrier family 19 (thiamine transporter), member 2/3 [Mytilus galloprovincialis]|uniref:Solute carrier family 19 (Thiamine transporter), member 2/3 n=1 Tax=Mytilus galloprovincialis TaxID=29158 RepID=A0A8B6CNS7_MYTGA|nr:solute carrier family 19 (thiamine transporter), member 2/3 [Mytilus galloprovincialis]